MTDFAERAARRIDAANSSPGGVIESLRSAGALIFDQGDRLIRLRFAVGSGLSAEQLLPQRLHGEEGLSKNYRYTLDCLSPDAFIELKDLLGQSVEIGLQLADGDERIMTGVVTCAEQRGADGGFANYRLIVEPALAALAHRRNSRVFQDKSVPEIVAAILDEHIAANPAFSRGFTHRAELVASYPPRSYCVQYRESDLTFVERLLFEEGISYRYAHEADDTPLHTLVLFDANAQLTDLGVGPLRFHRSEGVEDDDAIDAWSGSRQIASARTTLASFDYKAVSTHAGSEETRIAQGDEGSLLDASLEDYDPQTLYYGSDPNEVGRYATLRQRAKDLACKTFSGEGSVRLLTAGTWFELADHPLHEQDDREDRQFVVTRVIFDAENNFVSDAPSGDAGPRHPPFRNRFTAVRRSIPLVPPFGAAQQKPTAGGMTTATVVGPEGEEIFTDEHGRIKVQFHWQRRDDHPQGGADLDERSSTWVRVAAASAGAGWGTQYIPRIGQEVVVSFMENDIDRPLVTGVVYNGSHRPPTFSGAGNLPANKTLSGTKSKEYKGSLYNELLFDDTTGEVRAKLSSEHGKSQLNQGYLIHPRSAGKGEPRGEGFELRTDRQGAIRAAQGLLLSTEAQATANGKQMGRQHAQRELDAALALTKNLADVAAKQAADKLETGPQKIDSNNSTGETVTSGHLRHHLDALNAWEAGSNTDTEAKTANDETGRQPLMVLSAPAGIASVSAQNQTFAAGTNLDLVAQRDTNQTSGRRWLHNVGEHISLFVNGVRDKISLKLIAAQGNAQLQTQHGSVEVTADQDVALTACKGRITLAAKQEVLLTSGGGYIRIKDGNIEIHCPGIVSIKGKRHQLTGPTSIGVPLPQFPGATCLPCLLASLESGAPVVAPLD